MTDIKTVKITDPAHAASISEWYGLVRAEQALEQVKMDALPGFGLAKALVAKEAADARAQAMRTNLMAVARDGIDIVQTKNISLEFKRGVPVLLVEMMDLADLAEAEDQP